MTKAYPSNHVLCNLCNVLGRNNCSKMLISNLILNYWNTSIDRSNSTPQRLAIARLDYANYLSLGNVGYVGEASKRNGKITRKLNGTPRFFDRIVPNGSSIIGGMHFAGERGTIWSVSWQSSQTRKKHTWQCWKSAPLVRETAGRDFAHVVETFLRNWVKCPYWHSFSAWAQSLPDPILAIAGTIVSGLRCCLRSPSW